MAFVPSVHAYPNDVTRPPGNHRAPSPRGGNTGIRRTQDLAYGLQPSRSLTVEGDRLKLSLIQAEGDLPPQADVDHPFRGKSDW